MSGHGVGPREAANSARAHRESHALALAEAAEAEAHPAPRGRPLETGARDFIKENCQQAGLASRRPRSAATRHELSEPKLQPLSKMVRRIQGLLRRNETSGSRELDLSSFRMGLDSAEYIASVLTTVEITTLKLTNCALTDRCLEYLRQALMDLKDNCVLEQLFLGVNRLSPAGVELLCEWLERDESLLLLDLQVQQQQIFTYANYSEWKANQIMIICVSKDFQANSTKIFVPNFLRLTVGIAE